jgi:hypothetical protein
MSLYGRTDSNENKAKIENLRNAVPNTDTETIVFVDNTEAALAENKKRGINAPGWWSYRTYTDSSGKTRHKAEHLVFISNPDLNANETQADDTIAADATSVITISVQPSNQTTDDLDGTATFSVTAADAPDLGDIVYQWQMQTATGTRWTNVTGGTTDTLALTGLTTSDSGKKYRVKLTSTAGATEVISDAATLTVTAA